MSFLSNLSTKWKLISGFLVVAAITACVGGIGFWGDWRLARSVHEIGEVRMPSVENLLVIKGQAENMRGTLRTLAMPGLSGEMRQRQSQNIATAREVYEAAWAIYEPLPKTPEEAKLWEQFVPAWQAWREENNRALEMFSQFDRLGIPEPVEISRRLEGFIKDHYVLMENTLRAIQASKSFEGGEDHRTCNFGQWLSTFTTDSDVLKKAVQAMEEPHRRFHDAVREIKQLTANGQTDQALTVYEREMSPAAEETFGHFTDMLAVAEQATTAQREAIAHLFGPVTDRQRAAAELLDQIIHINEEIATEEVADAQSMATLAEYMALGGTAIGFVLAVTFGLFLASSIARVLSTLIGEAKRLGEAAVAGKLETRGDPGLVGTEFRPIIEGVNATLDAVIGPLNVAAEYVDRISKGDIPERITDNYQGDFNEIKNNLNQCIDALNAMTRQGDIGQALHRMNDKDFSRIIEREFPGVYGELRDNVNGVVGNMRAALEQINESANQFAEGARVIAESSQSLAQGAQSQSSSVEEMSASIEELARSVETVKENATAADKLATETNSLAEQGGTAVQKSSESMALIRTSSNQIGEIIQVISEIASQTNLLALNAAIEAARAGEHGMGFAVVADEVRKLAERSNQAAQEVSTLIKESTARVEEGTRLSDDTAKALTQIIEGVQGTANRIAEIAAATVQQASNASEVSQAVQGVAQVTEQSAAGSEEMASSSEQLGAQAGALRDLAASFKLA
ncbi:MAG: methyl-accepting chemotaxis protein [Thermoguttaceae bacterium]|jgi:methyl-accepting chemotaxis protein|nr:methyl-accepting chemotaxis protein [Thermoguttaceae bacterium]